MTLRLAPDLDLPDDFATQGVAVIGVRGSGKSNTEVRFAELLYGAGIPFVAVDPKGDWYGLRMDGTGPGLPIPVFGGLYGDFPLDESLGARIADLLVDENLSAVLDVSRLSKTVALPRFLTAFCDRLMDRHQQEPHVRTVLLEEAHRYIPQTVKGEAARLKEAASSVLLEGRAFGLGCWACTQRPARLHNDVLEEVDTAIIHRIGVTATADLARVRKWVQHEDLSVDISKSLTKLKNGEAWVLSPHALEIVQRVQIERRTTFDSGATPLVGATPQRLVQGTMATIDAGAIKEALANSIAKAKADDPKTMRARIVELERDLAARPTETVTVEVPVSVIAPETLAELEALGEVGRRLDAAAAAFLTAMGPVIDAVTVAVAGTTTPGVTQRRKLPTSLADTAAEHFAGRRFDPVVPPMDGVYQPRAGARRMLEACATYPAGLSTAQVSTLSKVKRTGGTFGTYGSELQRHGLVTIVGSVKDGTWYVTAAGTRMVGGKALPTNPALLRAEWRDRLKAAGAKRMFDLLVDGYPDWTDRETLASDAHISIDGGTFGTYLSRLRSNGLIEEDFGGQLRAHPDLFMGED